MQHASAARTPAGRRTLPHRRGAVRAALAALLLTVLVAVPPSWAAFSATVPSTSSLAVQPSFPTYPTAIGRAWNTSTQSFSTAPADTKLEFHHRGEDGATASGPSTAADSSANSPLRNGTYNGGTNGPVLWWPLDEGSGTTVGARAGGSGGRITGPDGAAATGVSWTTRTTPSGQPGGDPALSFSSPNGYVESTGPVLDPTRDFSVSAWVRANARPGVNFFASAVAQEGRSYNAFYVGIGTFLDGTTGWIFSMPGQATPTDSTTQTYDSVVVPTDVSATASNEIGRWVHLVVTYTAGTRSMTLDVTPAGGTTRSGSTTRAAGSASWFDRPSVHPTCACSFVVGRARWNNGNADPWNGSVDDVRAYQRVLGPFGKEVSREDPHTSRWRFGDMSASQTSTTKDDVAARTATLGGGAGFSQYTRTDGKGLSLNGTGAFASAPAVVNTAASFSVSTWVWLNGSDITGHTGIQAFVSQNGVNSPGFVLGRHGTTFHFAIRQSDSATATVDTATYSWPAAGTHADRWTHLVGVQDAEANELRLYADGFLVASVAHTEWTSSAAGNLQFGRRLVAAANSTTYESPAVGTFDTVTTYGWALSLGDARDLSRDRVPSALGELGGDALGALDGPQKLGSQGGTKAVAFSGAVGMHNPRSYTSPQTFSLELWFRAGTGGALAGLHSNATTQGTGSYDRLLYLDSTGHLVFGVYPGVTRTVSTANPTVTPVLTVPPLVDGRWHHAVATLGPSGGMSLYLDGVLVARNTSVTGAEASTGFWRFGGQRLVGWPNESGINHYFTGLLDEVAVYSRELSAQDVAWHYHADH
ncbi:hypothetical protein NUM3379_41740 [Kineococcus sp. NUM-3379]